METGTISLINLEQKTYQRLELLKSLSDAGLNSKEITDHLNSRGVKTPSGKQYYPKLVWVTLDKYKKRLLRYDSTRILSINESLMVDFYKGGKLKTEEVKNE